MYSYSPLNLFNAFGYKKQKTNDAEDFQRIIKIKLYKLFIVKVCTCFNLNTFLKT